MEGSGPTAGEFGGIKGAGLAAEGAFAGHRGASRTLNGDEFAGQFGGQLALIWSQVPLSRPSSPPPSRRGSSMSIIFMSGAGSHDDAQTGSWVCLLSHPNHELCPSGHAIQYLDVSQLQRRHNVSFQ